MVPVIAGLYGLGGPEVAVLLALLALLIFLGFPGAAVVLVIYFVRSRRPGFTRYCPACGRGLTQAAEAPFCAYCGKQMP